jgi:PIN domain nuclease of toxin-antitoxin system
VNVLLDTRTLVWWDTDKLPKNVVSRIQRANEVYVSAATAWELAIKSALGKIALRGELGAVLQDYGFVELPVTIAHAEAVRRLPMVHRDPFDRMLVAQAMVEDLVIVSRDPLLREYDARVAWG